MLHALGKGIGDDWSDSEVHVGDTHADGDVFLTKGPALLVPLSGIRTEAAVRRVEIIFGGFRDAGSREHCCGVSADGAYQSCHSSVSKKRPAVELPILGHDPPPVADS